MALAYELSEKYSGKLKVACFADRDYEDYIPTVPKNQYLVLTDYNSIELYAFTPFAFDKFVSVALGGFPVDAITLRNRLAEILQKIYSIRLANEKLKWNMEWIPFVGSIIIKKIQYNF